MASKKDQNKEVTVLSSNADKNVPKFCTSINFGVLANNNIVITFTYNEGEKQPHFLIERVIVDVEHAKQLSEVLSDLLSKIEKGAQ